VRDSLARIELFEALVDFLPETGPCLGCPGLSLSGTQISHAQAFLDLLERDPRLVLSGVGDQDIVEILPERAVLPKIYLDRLLPAF